MLILEDLHWADEMSLRLLSFLGRRLGASSTLVVGTAREEDLARAPVLRRMLEDLVRDQRLLEMRLAALSKPDTLALVRTLARTQTDEAVVTSLAEQIWIFSEGNPFVVVETLRSLPKDATPRRLSKLAVPQRVRETIVRHLEQLSEGSRELAAVAAVIGREFDFPLLPRSAGFVESEAAALVEELVRRRLMSFCLLLNDLMQSLVPALYPILKSSDGSRRGVRHGATQERAPAPEGHPGGGHPRSPALLQERVQR